jgi:hypothetical protein
MGGKAISRQLSAVSKNHGSRKFTWMEGKQYSGGRRQKTEFNYEKP